MHSKLFRGPLFSLDQPLDPDRDAMPTANPVKCHRDDSSSHALLSIPELEHGKSEQAASERNR
jgi:hypothetical protein